MGSVKATTILTNTAASSLPLGNVAATTFDLDLSESSLQAKPPVAG